MTDSTLSAFAVEWPSTGQREGRADHTITLVKSDKELVA
jgi:hypothetical protein